MPTLLIVYCSFSGNTKAAAEEVARGARAAGAQVVFKPASQADAKDLLACDGVAFGSYDAFSYMGGMLKDFFDRTFYAAQHHVTGKPFIAFMSSVVDGRGIHSIETIAQSFKLTKVADSVLLEGAPQIADLAKLRELGAKLAIAATHRTSAP